MKFVGEAGKEIATATSGGKKDFGSSNPLD